MISKEIRYSLIATDNPDWGAVGKLIAVDTSILTKTVMNAANGMGASGKRAQARSHTDSVPT
jgi:hypothetical protein